MTDFRNHGGDRGYILNLPLNVLGAPTVTRRRIRRELLHGVVQAVEIPIAGFDALVGPIELPFGLGSLHNEQPTSVRAVLLNDVLRGDDVALGLRHLFAV